MARVSDIWYGPQEKNGAPYTFVAKGFQMNQHRFAFSFALIAALLVAVPATGQLVGFPVFAIPSGDGDASTTVALQWSRGLNSDSGENPGYVAYGVRSMERISFSVAVGRLIGDIDEFTFGGQVAYHLLSDGGDAQISVQAGVGYMALSAASDVTLLTGDLTTMNFPIGVALEARPSEFGRIWIMPRLNLFRESDDVTSKTRKQLGFSLGGSISSEGGFGIHAGLDFVDLKDSAPLIGAIGFHYTLPN